MNDALFRSKVAEQGIKYKYICETLGISASALDKKRKGKIPYKVKEINGLVRLLHLNAKDRDEIFDLESTE